jgi:ATPase subunit of ABC transporter with duplicated ATPase domains
MSPAEVRTLLAKFGLRADHVTRPVDELSPGERTRAGLALLQARGVNLLVLDEPTNHLDLPAIEQLEQALDSYDGTLLLVTHDRRMLDAVRLDRHWHVDAGRVTES